jgi:hypothetical protein
MSRKSEEEIYRECSSEFIHQIAASIQAVIGRAPELSAEAKGKLVKDLTFAVACHLSGSSFAGSVAGEELYPLLGFYKGEANDQPLFGNGAAMHELVSQAVGRLKSTP